MNNHDDKKEKAEELFINNLFEKKEKDQNEQLYKNEFYILEEEMKSKKNQNNLQFMHDILLNKLMLEDYVPFPPKNEEPLIVNSQKEEKKKEDDQDKLIEEENEFLRSLHKINYLTFSPFGLSFFEDNGKDKSNMNEDILKEREEKILHMIDFNYDNFEVTNDLLLNICQGFVDINRLKEENLNINKEKEKLKQKEKLDALMNSKQEEKPKEEIQEKKKEVLEKFELDFIAEINEKKMLNYYSDFLKPCETEFNEAKNKNERKNVIEKWKPLIKNKDKEYRQYLKEKEEKERKEKEERMRLEAIQRQIDKEREEEQKKNDDLMKAFQDIIKKTKKKEKKENKSKSQNKVYSMNKQVKPRNQSNKISPKKSAKTNNNLLRNEINKGGTFNITTKYFNKNYSKSQTKIKTYPKNYLK